MIEIPSGAEPETTLALVTRIAGEVGLNLDLLTPETDLAHTGKLAAIAHHAALELGLEPPLHLLEISTIRDIVHYLTGAELLKAAIAANALAPRIEGISVAPPLPRWITVALSVSLALNCSLIVILVLVLLHALR